MNEHDNSIRDVLDEAVEALTRLVHLTAHTSHATGTDVGFADRLVDTVTHVAANVRGVDQLTAHSTPEAGALLRGC